MRGLRLCAVAALCVAAVGACTGTEAQPPIEPATSLADPAPAGTGGTDAPSPGVPFDLTVEHIALVGMDNAEIVGVAGATPNEHAAVQAVAGARAALAAFLDAQLVAEGSRFTAGPIDALLTPRAHAALTEEDRAGLGQVPLHVTGTITGPAVAQAQVLVLGDQIDAVTLTYRALLTVVLPDNQHVPASQSGSITFLPTAVGWRADALEVTSDLPAIVR